MKTNGQITKIANGTYKEAVEGLNNLIEVKKTAVKGIEKMSVDEGIALISGIVADVEAIVKAPRVDGFGLPEFLSKIQYTDGSLDTITISIRSKLKSAVKFSKSYDINVDKDIVENIGKAYLGALVELFYIEVAQENAEDLNEKIAEICAANEIPFTFSFAVVPDSDAIVLAVDNNSVQFNAKVASAHEIANLGIFQSGDSYYELVCKESTEKLINDLKAVQTTPQLIKSNIELIKDVTGVSTKKRASKLIRGSYHRQAKFLGGVKAGIGYFDETVKIGKEEVEVFALVEKAENGDLSVVLNPFDVKTLLNVDFDVIKEVKKALA